MDVEDRLKEIEARFEQVEAEMSTLEAATDHDRMRTLGQQFAELDQIVRPYRELRKASADAAEAMELANAETDPEMAEAFLEEGLALRERVEKLRARLEQLLVPKDPNEGKDVILEIRAGAGGQEAALWAGDLYRDVPAPRGPAPMEDRRAGVGAGGDWAATRRSCSGSGDGTPTGG